MSLLKTDFEKYNHREVLQNLVVQGFLVKGIRIKLVLI